MAASETESVAVSASELTLANLEPAGESGITPGKFVARGPLPSSAVSSEASNRAAGLNSGPQPAGPMTYHGGPIMTQMNVYAIFYGNWPAGDPRVPILTDFMKSLGGTSYQNTNSTYWDANGNHVTTNVSLAGTYYDSGSQGTSLTRTKVSNIVYAAITKVDPTTLKTPLPIDANGVYVVFTSPNIGHSGGGLTICTEMCAYHWYFNQTGFPTIKFAFIPDLSTACPTKCGAETVSPNGNSAADEMVDSLAHELVESGSDPDTTAWYAQGLDENADICATFYGPLYPTPKCGNTPCADVHIGNRDYHIQGNYVNLGPGVGFCSIRYLRNNDLLWRNGNGDVLISRSDGASTPVFFPILNALPFEWAPAGRGDFDGDGNGDFLWRNVRTGDVVAWQMAGTTPIASQAVALGLPLVWTSVGVGDFNGDGRADILWRNTQTGDVVSWTMNGFTVTAVNALAAALPFVWVTSGVGDFDGDNKADILWRNTSSGDVVLWLGKGGAATLVRGIQSVWQIIGVGDFDGNGKSDVLLWNTSTKDVNVWMVDGVTVKSSTNVRAAFTGYELIGVGDYDGNGKADITWRNTTTGDLVTWRMNGAAISATFTPLRGTAASLASYGTFSDET